MSKKRMLADVLWEAANEHLEEYFYSCHAVYAALYGAPSFDEPWPCDCEVDGFLRSLGCDPETSGFFEFRGEPEARRGVRYMWLLLAMHVAEDEGIEV